MRVLVEVIDPVGIEGRRPPDQCMDLVSLFQQELCQIRAVLPSNPGDESCLLQLLPPGIRGCLDRCGGRVLARYTQFVD